MPTKELVSERVEDILISAASVPADFARVRHEFEILNRTLRRQLLDPDATRGDVLDEIFAEPISLATQRLDAVSMASTSSSRIPNAARISMPGLIRSSTANLRDRSTKKPSVATQADSKYRRFR